MDHALGQLEDAQMSLVAQVAHDLVQGRLGLRRPGDDACADALAETFIGVTDDRHVRDSRMRGEKVFNFLGKRRGEYWGALPMMWRGC